jgi:hypothetical protein
MLSSASHFVSSPCHDIAAEIRTRLQQLGPEARVAVLPQGPLMIP